MASESITCAGNLFAHLLFDITIYQCVLCLCFRQKQTLGCFEKKIVQLVYQEWQDRNYIDLLEHVKHSGILV